MRVLAWASSLSFWATTVNNMAALRDFVDGSTLCSDRILARSGLLCKLPPRGFQRPAQDWARKNVPNFKSLFSSFFPGSYGKPSSGVASSLCL